MFVYLTVSGGAKLRKCICNKLHKYSNHVIKAICISRFVYEQDATVLVLSDLTIETRPCEARGNFPKRLYLLNMLKLTSCYLAVLHKKSNN